MTKTYATAIGANKRNDNRHILNHCQFNTAEQVHLAWQNLGSFQIILQPIHVFGEKHIEILFQVQNWQHILVPVELH